MERQDLVKLAYAYGVSTALQEAGMNKEAANQEAMAFAEEQIKRATLTPEQEAIYNLIGIQGVGMPSEQASALADASARTQLGGLKGMGAGAGIGGLSGAGLGALIGALSKQKGATGASALVGGLSGLLPGAGIGANVGMDRAGRRAYEDYVNKQQQE